MGGAPDRSTIFMLGQAFNIFSLFYAFLSLRLVVTLWRERADIGQPPLTHRKKGLAEQAAFFIAVPIGVFFHEFGHAFFVLLFNGRIIQFAYRGFWGFVEHVGNYSAPERWLISLAGTIGSLLFGLVVWLLFRRNRVPALRYFGLRAFRFQTYFSLIYYP
ncbi:MAG: M50 family metallopeptidase, partial [Anaerolineae bacterium]